MSVDGLITALLMTFQITSSLVRTQAVEHPASVVPAQWHVSCPTDRVGADGKALCTAEHLAFPVLSISRTDTGMRVITVAECGRARNALGQDVRVFRRMGGDISLKTDASTEQIQTALIAGLRRLPLAIKKACSSFKDDGRFDLDQSQMPWMIDTVFVKKQVR